MMSLSMHMYYNSLLAGSALLYILLRPDSLLFEARGLVKEGQESLALDVLERLGVGGVTGRAGGDTEGHKGAALHMLISIPSRLCRGGGLTTQVSGKPSNSRTLPSALGSNSR